MRWFIVVLLAVAVFPVEKTMAQPSIDETPPEPWPWVESAGEGTVALLLLGDTNIMERADPAEPFRYVLPTLREADLRYANLEGPFAGSSEEPVIPHKSNWRHSEQEMVMGLVAAGIDAVGVANNVTYPWQALLKSLDVLDAHGIPHVGGGRNLEEAHQPLILEREGVRFGFLQYTANYWPYQHAATPDQPGVAAVKVDTWYQPPPQVLDKPGQPPIIRTEPKTEDLERMKEDIRALRSKADIVVASYHWGVSGSTEIAEYQRTMAHAAIDAGADIIHGHGPHVSQPVEIYMGRPILYSLSNFAFDWEAVRDKPYGLLARVLVEENRPVALSIVPLRRDAENHVLMLDPREGIGKDLYRELVEISLPLGTEMEVQGKEIVVRGVAALDEKP